MVLNVLSKDLDVIVDLEKEFLNYCENNSLSEDQNHTLVSIKERYKIESCKNLYNKLKKLEFISIRDKNIKDITLFKYFDNIKRLGLDKNKIIDLSILQDIGNITYLSLRDNQITDVRPLLNIKSLEQVFLDGNPIKKESEQCPITTNIIDINEFCFDEEKFDKEFKEEKLKSNITKLDIRTIIEKIINYSKLQKFYHIDKIPERSPLQVYFNFDMTTDELELQKFNDKVEVIKKTNKLALQIKIEIRGKMGIAKFIYPPEGIRGNFRLRETEGGWKIFKSHIYE